MEPLDEIPASLIASFREEARELLVDMEGALMELEQRPGDLELIARAFRALHTIKGNGAMFGFEELEALAHELEHVFDLLRKEKMAISREIIDLTLSGKDRLLALLFDEGGTEVEQRERAAVRRQIERVLGASAAPAAPPSPPPSPERTAAVRAEAKAAPAGDPEEPLPAALVTVFKEEARELLADLEGALMELEQRPDDAELIARAFRSLHTIKGNGAMFGFVELEIFAHELENVFDLLRKGKVSVTRELIDLTLEARDRIQHLLDGGDDEAERALRDREVAVLHRIAERRKEGGAASAPASVPPAAPAAGPGYRIGFRPESTLLARGTNPLAVLEDLRGLGTCRVAVQLGDVPTLAGLDPAAGYLGWEIELDAACAPQDVLDAFIFVGGDSAVRVEACAAPEPAAPEPAARPARRAEDVVERERYSECGPSAASAASAEPVVATRASDTSSSLRVESAKLDKLVNLVGELVTVQARLSRVAADGQNPELVTVAEEVERLTEELRDTSLNIRMVPIGPSFGKFRRLVRDLANGIGREVDLETEGGDTELDKTVIDRLGDPLIHLLRNSIDHGIEGPEERERAGKPRRGTVRLAASYSGANVVIRVSDDGSGIDVEAVRRKAVERGLVGEHDQRTERELFALMFLPGFSTSAKITSISGRGVGLDVVKRAVEVLRGAVRVESRRGQGTTFEVRLPLTLAIIEGLEVVVGAEHFIIPLSAVKECVELAGRARAGSGRRLADIRGELVPYVTLRDWFSVPGDPPPLEQIVVTETDGFGVGLVVDYVVGEQQTVIKPLGRVFRGVLGLAGATIQGDGSVALILDIAQLVHRAEQEEHAASDGS
jgi:two-component system chemotaxis sensor kinase CheA